MLLEESVAILGDATVAGAQFNQRRNVEKDFIEGASLLEGVGVIHRH
jgi:hypothetical protein